MNAIEYLLTCLAEEAGEVVQAACKAGRFGVTDAHPDRNLLPNNEYIVRELNDQLAVVEMLRDAGVPLPGIGDRAAINAKKQRVLEYMEYSVKRGKLSMVVDELRTVIEDPARLRCRTPGCDGGSL